MEAVLDLFVQSLGKVWLTFTHNWPFLLVSVLVSVALRMMVHPEKVSAVIMRYRRAGVAGATAVAVATPFCSCGTTAVVLGMMASTIPWAPIVAFMVASPLTSPEELIYSAGLFGWPFAITFFVSSILLGLLGGMVADFCEGRGWLANQARFSGSIKAKKASCSCQVSQPANQPVRFGEVIGESRPALAAQPVLAGNASCCVAPVVVPAPACGCGSAQPSTPVAPARSAVEQPAAKTEKPSLRQWIEEFLRTGKQLLVMFLGFAFLGYLINGLIPPEWVAAIFGSGNAYSVPLAATLGVPFYINSEGSLPLVRALIDGGMSQGAALAFLITGSGTSIGAVAGALTIARWRIIALVVGTLWVGSVVLGYAYNLILMAGWF